MVLVSQSRLLIRTASRSTLRLSGAVAPRYGSASSRLYTSTMHDNDPELLETEKKRNLSQEQHKTSTPLSEHAPGWNEHLASTSEASVKADRHTSSPEEMQKGTVDYVQRRHSPDDRVQSTQASYLKEQIDGPLGSVVHESRDQVRGPLGSAAQSQTEKTVEKTAQETTRVHKDSSPTGSEETVKADRGEV
ncbi:hypothetical protein K435DRAFT_959914 [Dendrothele bispora CBS 962.96]|uniref:Uncharacterized protein n=1 Tax=Dendrothele bispora (strain CBS 962.96) TaxID=1314807 RepID=A0A4S8MX96_DENBC|nr:hypothetical protein K435DRAFT_959914 [Dendrothele bispora CBS 962.96]